MDGSEAVQRISRAFSTAGVGTHLQPAEVAYRQPLVAVGLLAVMLLAVGLRLVPIIFVPSVNWGDEIFQAVEPAHRLIYGYGLVPWEFQLGMRSWLLPGIVAGLIELVRPIGDGPAYYQPAIATAFALLASTPVLCCFFWCRRWHGLAAAFVGATAVAISPELVYFGARTLTEVVAAHLLVVACYLIEPGYPVSSRRRLFVAGILFGLVCLLRVHLAPAVALVVIWSARDAWRVRFPAILAGGLAVVAFGAIFDWLTLGYPLASVWRNVLFNVLYGVSADFGTEPWNYYLLGEFGLWAGGMVFLLALAGLGARRAPALLVAAVTVVLVHSGIAHKEYRFIYPAILLLTVLAGLGLAQLVDWGTEWLAGRGIGRRTAVIGCATVLVGYWCALVFAVWTGPGFVQLRDRDHDNLMAVSYAAEIPGLCGIGLYGEHGRDWVWYGGYSHLHRPVPMYWPVDEAELAATAPAFDTLLYTAAPPLDLGYATLQCFGHSCVARRPGICDARAMAAMPFPDPVAGLAPPKEAFAAIPPRPGKAVAP
jgi:phosphatidylinositol glycan class B